MNRWMILICLVVLVGAGCNRSADNSLDEMVPETAPSTEQIVPSEGSQPTKAETSLQITDDTLPLVEVEMASGNFFFDPASIAVQTGQMVEITFTENTGTHTFVIDEIGLKETVVAGETIRFRAPEKAGQYEFYCDVGSHRVQGMVGVLGVKEL